MAQSRWHRWRGGAVGPSCEKERVSGWWSNNKQGGSIRIYETVVFSPTKWATPCFLLGNSCWLACLCLRNYPEPSIKSSMPKQFLGFWETTCCINLLLHIATKHLQSNPPWLPNWNTVAKRRLRSCSAGRILEKKLVAPKDVERFIDPAGGLVAVISFHNFSFGWLLPPRSMRDIQFFFGCFFLSELFCWIMLMTSFLVCFKTWDPKDPAKFPYSNSSGTILRHFREPLHQQKKSSWHLKPWTRLYDFLDDCGSFWSRIPLKQLPFPTAVDWWCRDFVCFCEFTLVNLKKSIPGKPVF